WLEWWPASYRNGGRCLIGMAAGFTSESALALHVKLDELLRAVGEADIETAKIDHKEPEEIEVQRERKQRGIEPCPAAGAGTTLQTCQKTKIGNFPKRSAYRSSRARRKRRVIDRHVIEDEQPMLCGSQGWAIKECRA
ncbi:hypothetical protein NKJ72_29960, partial [Mesorhizobium sp. M0045]